MSDPTTTTITTALPDTANESYKGTFPTDVYDPSSTVKQPNHLLFADSSYRVLKQVHPDTEINLGATYIIEDYNRHLLRTLAEKASCLAENWGKCHALAYLRSPRKGTSNSVTLCLEAGEVEAKAEDFVIVGQSGGKYLVWLKSSNDYFDDTNGYEDRAVVERYLGLQLMEWDSKGPAEKKKIFDEWLQKAQSSKDMEDDYYPGQISSRDIQSAVRMSLPGELAKHAVSEGTKAVTKYTSSSFRSKEKKSRSRRAGLQFDVDQIGELLSQIDRKSVV